MSQLTSLSLLKLWGWERPTHKELKKLNNNDTGKTIIIISHTSYWDFFLLMLYRQAEPIIGKNLYLVVKPQAFKEWGWFLEPMGCIPATRSEDTGGGFIERTTHKFQDKNFKIVISPEGKLVASKWRSGYYHLAKNLKASILVAGLDYKKRKIVFGDYHSYSKIIKSDYETFQNNLMDEMSKITPLYPEHSYVNITSNSKDFSNSPRVSYEAVGHFPLFLTFLFIGLLAVLLIYGIYYLIKFGSNVRVRSR